MIQKFITTIGANASSKLKRHGIAFLFFGLLLVILRFSSIRLLSSHYLGGAERDAGLYIWLSNVALQSLSLDGWFTTNAFFPYAKTLAWSDCFILPAIAVKLLAAFLSSHVLAYNIAMLLAAYLNGAFVYLLTHQLIGNRLAALLSGSCFISLGYFSSNLGHPQLQFAFFLPLSTILALRALKSRTFWSGFSLSVCIGATFLTTVYFAVFCILGAGTLIFLDSICLTPKKVTQLKALFLGCIVGILPFIPFVLPYLDVQATFGGRHFYESYEFGATSLSYLSHSPQSLLYSFSSSWSHSEAWLFPGIVLLCLSLFESIQTLTSYRRTVFVGTLAVFALICFLPEAIRTSPLICCVCSLLLWLQPYLFFQQFKIDRHHHKPAIIGFCVFFCGLSFGSLSAFDHYWWDFSPYSTLFRCMPGMSGVRVSARLGLIALMLMCIVPAFTVVEIKKSSSRWCFSFLFVAIVVIENWVVAYPVETLPPTPEAIDKLISINPNNSVALILPLTTTINSGGRVSSWSDFAFQNVNAMNWFSDSSIHLVNGYSGIRSDIIENYPRKLSGFPDARSMTTLGLLPNLDYIVVLPQYTQHRTAEKLKEAIQAYSEQLSIVHEGNDGSVLLQLKPITRNITKDSFLLRIPAQQESTLTVDLRFTGDRSNSDQSAIVDVVSVDASGAETSLPTIDVPKGSEWNEVEIRLSAKSPGIAPHFLRFSPRKFSAIDVGKRRWKVVK
jgi:hypothetical protein